MEKLYAAFLLAVHGFTDHAAYESLLHEAFLGDAANPVLLELEDLSADSKGTMGRFLRYVEEEEHPLHAGPFARALFAGMEPAWRREPLDLPDFCEQGLALWESLPESIRWTDPFEVLYTAGCNMAECSMFENNEKQMRAAYEKIFAEYGQEVKPMSDPMVEVSHITMDFRLDRNRTTNLKEYVVNVLTGKANVARFHALDDVTFSVPRGSVTGLIGHNGAGKSTLLKIISGIYKPTSGSVTVRGRVSPMLELGSGFDAELTGRENILLNGAVLGYRKDFLYGKMDEIIEYSELGAFIHQPLKTYSSGMLARLAFSIATVVTPDVLIVDEILSVGDEHFQRKSRARMMELMSGGTTVLFVSHDLGQLRQMCDRVVWVDHGKVRLIGETQMVCDAYEREK